MVEIKQVRILVNVGRRLPSGGYNAEWVDGYAPVVNGVMRGRGAPYKTELGAKRALNGLKINYPELFA